LCCTACDTGMIIGGVHVIWMTSYTIILFFSKTGLTSSIAYTCTTCFTGLNTNSLLIIYESLLTFSRTFSHIKHKSINTFYTYLDNSISRITTNFTIISTAFFTFNTNICELVKKIALIAFNASDIIAFLTIIYADDFLLNAFPLISEFQVFLTVFAFIFWKAY